MIARIISLAIGCILIAWMLRVAAWLFAPRWR